ncbi:MAG: slipin family protein [Elusimicrobia bacterium]|nr:slipin family protein [Elusimicrobiota bacterium]
MGIHPLTLTLFAALAAVGGAVSMRLGHPLAAIVGVATGLIVLFALRIARQWQKAVILRLGKFHALRGPGLFCIVPGLDTIPYWIDLRTFTSSFAAERTLTKDSVPVDVDAVLFWRVLDPVKAALEVENYQQAIAWSSQTALRDAIGDTDLAKMLVGRQEIDTKLQQMIEHRTAAWGIQVLSVEIRDVKIPEALQNAMSMQAQAERERQARLILGDSELQVANKFKEASRSYAENPVALHLRAMNILLEGMRQNSTVVIVPSSAVETMGLGAMSGLTSLAKEFARPQAGQGPHSEENKTSPK